MRQLEKIRQNAKKKIKPLTFDKFFPLIPATTTFSLKFVVE